MRSPRGSTADALLAAVNDRTRVLVLCNPNDPTGEWLSSEEVGTLLARLPDHVTVLLDEALADFADAEPPDATLRLLDAFPRLVILRTFSKAWGLAGLRCGYALGGPGSEPLLEAIGPPLGVGELQQAGALAALRSCGALVAARRAAVAHERRRLAAALHDLPVDAPHSQANLVWLAAPGLSGAELAARLERHAVLVAPGGPLGAEDHVRAAIQSAAPRTGWSARSGAPWATPRARRWTGAEACRSSARRSAARPGSLLLGGEMLDDLAHPRGGDLDAVAARRPP